MRFATAPLSDLCFYLNGDYLLASERLNKRGDRKEFENDTILKSMQNSFGKRILDYDNVVVLDAMKRRMRLQMRHTKKS